MRDAQEMQAKILAEGSQNPMLDLDFGIYPYVTNSNTGLGGIVTGFAVSRRNTKQVIGIHQDVSCLLFTYHLIHNW